MVRSLVPSIDFGASRPNCRQVFYAFSATLICWVIWAYKMGFGEQWGKFPLVGMPGPVLSMQQNLAQASLPSADLSPNFNLSTMIYFQFVFAAITVIILGGSLLGRMNFVAWMAFVPLWITFSYTVGAFRLVVKKQCPLCTNYRANTIPASGVGAFLARWVSLTIRAGMSSI